MQYPDILDLSTIFNLKSDDYYIDEKYKLSGVIEHFGTAHGGHYVAYRPLFNHKLDQDLRENETWLLCDDSDITFVKKDEVLKRRAYMLIYEKLGVEEIRRDRDQIKPMPIKILNNSIA